PIIEVGADQTNDLCALLEYGSDVAVGDQIGISLPVSGLDVLEAVVLVGGRQEGLRQERQRLCVNRQFVCASAENRSLDANVIAEVEQLEQSPGALIDFI